MFVQRVDGSGARASVIVVLVVALGFVTFMLGHRLGAETGAPPTSVAVATTAPTPAPNPSVEPLLEPGAVSEALRQAYYAAGAGVSVCVGDETPRCISGAARELWYGVPRGSFEPADVCVIGEPGCPPMEGIAPTDDDPYFSWAPEAWPALPPTAIPAGRVVAVADLETEVALAILVRLDPGPYAQRDLLPAPVNPGGQGIGYFDLGSLDGGRYLVLISHLMPTGNATVPFEGPWGWRLLGLELLVQGPGFADRPRYR